MHRIEISGGIATGKTTLARRLSKFARLSLFEEPFRKVPFWKEAYESASKKYVFQKNVAFMVFHAKWVTQAMRLKRSSVCDFALFQDLAYFDLSPREEANLLECIFEKFAADLDKADVIVNWTCPVETQLVRIRRRRRKPEKTIDKALLQDLQNRIEFRRSEAERRHSIEFVHVDSAASNFRDNPQEVEKIWKQIKAALKRRPKFRTC
jgi:deoxyadenosine/deoxycytidine kinase